MGRNALDAFGQQITGRRMADVAQADDADHSLALVDHRQPADLERLHVPHRLGEVVVLPAAMDALGHHIARGCAAGIEAVLRQPFADDVAVGHHADQPVVLSNWNGAYIMFTHQFREFGDRGVRTDPVDSLVHRVLDFHGDLPRWSWVDSIKSAPAPLDVNSTTDRVLWHEGPPRPPRRSG